MDNKKINFSIREISGRSFELSLTELREKYLELGHDSCEDVSINQMIIEILGDELNNLNEFEKCNNYFEWDVTHINY